MRRTILSSCLASCLAVGLVLAPRPSVAAEPTPQVAELQALHGQAQARVERYNTSYDVADLTTARELLAQWLVGHRALYGDTPAATSVRAPIEQQLGMIDAELLRVGAVARPVPVAPMGPPVAAPPPPRPTLTPEQSAELGRARAWTAGGTTSLVVGGVMLAGVSMPLWLLRERALRRANEEQFYVDEQRLVSRARRRNTGAIATFAVGATLAGAGIAMLTVGGVKRSRVRRELSVAPAFGAGFAGASATLRF